MSTRYYEPGDERFYDPGDEDACGYTPPTDNGAEDDWDDNAVYKITPKGIAALALKQCGLVQSIDDDRVNGFWKIFSVDMEQCGYIVDEEDISY